LQLPAKSIALRARHIMAGTTMLGLVAGAGLASAQSPQAPASVDDARSRLEAGKDKLDQNRRRTKTVEAELGEIAAERERINRQLIETADVVQRSEGQLTALEGRLEELGTQEKLLRGSLESRHESIGRLLGAMQRMGRDPPPVMITRREDALKMVRSAMLLARAFPELSQQAQVLASRLGELATVMGEIKRDSETLRSETAKLNDTRLKLASLLELKRQSLTERSTELRELRSAALEISKNVTDLSELIVKLDQQVMARVQPPLLPPVQPSQTSPEPAAPTLPRLPPPTSAASAPPEPPPQMPSTAIAALPPPPVPKEAPARPRVAFELAPKDSTLRDAPAARMRPAIAFASARGQLRLPAQGKRVLAFGDKTQHSGPAKGVYIETRASAQVRAPSDGWVVFAGPFRTFGQLLIINADDGYHVVLAGMSQIDVQFGQFVLAGEPVGTMSAPPRSIGRTAPTAAPVLYVEFRKDGRPIDPDPWWATNTQKVAG